MRRQPRPRQSRARFRMFLWCHAALSSSTIAALCACCSKASSKVSASRCWGVATNGRDGAELVRKTLPAVVCLDVDMPVMTGIEALPHVQAASAQSKVVMITGNAGRDVVQAAVAVGAKGYFLKPIRPAKVEEFMKKLLKL